MLRGGPNIAVKVPPDWWEATLRFYGETLGLARIDTEAPAVVFAFGVERLRVERIEKLHEPEIWLEYQTDSSATTTALLSDEGFVHGDGNDPLPRGFHRFWIAGPADFLRELAVSGQAEPGARA